ncbi:MAG: lysophospholipid acyltransferase family protein [Termitinemataceae bacterium]|nr:MAG: lysophospholipid acyltransferase family protein [Termitinemataceae bacterium]
MRVHSTIIGFILVVFACVGFLVFAVFFGILRLLGLKKFSTNTLHKIVGGFGKFIIFAIGCKIHCTGTENIPMKHETGLCFVSNHTGIFDIILLLSTTDVPFGFIAKKELRMVPFINIWIWILGGMYIDRSTPRKAIETLKKCTKKMRGGASIVVFPEGTRSKGRGLLPFKAGTFKMALDAAALIIPCAITGGYEVLEQKGIVNARNIYISFGKPIDPSEIEGDHKKTVVCEQVRSSIAQMLSTHGPVN